MENDNNGNSFMAAVANLETREVRNMKEFIPHDANMLNLLGPVHVLFRSLHSSRCCCCYVESCCCYAESCQSLCRINGTLGSVLPLAGKIGSTEWSNVLNAPGWTWCCTSWCPTAYAAWVKLLVGKEWYGCVKESR